MKRRKRGRTLGDTTISQLPNPAGGVRIQTFVPWTLIKRRYTKHIITPLGSPEELQAEGASGRENNTASIDSALVRALGQAHYWQRLLDEHHMNSISEIAEVEKTDVTQIRRVLRLTLLAPWLIEEMLRFPQWGVSAVTSLKFPVTWSQQSFSANHEACRD